MHLTVPHFNHEFLENLFKIPEQNFVASKLITEKTEKLGFFTILMSTICHYSAPKK